MKIIIIAIVALFTIISIADAHPNHTCHFHSDTTQHCK
jgi:hypothetical protein